MTAASADLRQLAADLSSASKVGMFRAAADVVRTTATAVQAEARSKAPMRTGKLRNSIQVTYTSPLSASVGPTVPYGPYQEFGTATRGEFPGPMYEIRPVRASKLAFKIDGKWVFTKLVKHPGIPPRPYMRPAIQTVLGKMAPELARTGALLVTKGPNA